MKRILLPTYIVVISMVLMAAIGCRNGTGRSDSESLGELFKVIKLHTNDVEGTAIIDAKTKEPIWMKWFFERTGLANQICYCFEGKVIMDVYLVTNGPPRRDVIYYDTNGLEKVYLGDRSGVGLFTDRIFYENGNPRVEVWYNQAWRTVEERDKKRGVKIDGNWMGIRLSNGVWAVQSPVNTNDNSGKAESP